MAIPIIGRSGPGETTAEAHPLPTPEVDLPAPDQAPEAKPVLDEARATELLAHPSALLRGLAAERLMRNPDRHAHAEKLLPLLEDPDQAVVATVLRILAEVEHAGAIDAVAHTFARSSGDLAGHAAAALGRLSPERLLEEVKKRSRLDDLAYVQTMTSLARSESAAAIEHLGKSMNRAGAIAPERRAALYSAALLSGAGELCGRVIGLAISDSRAEQAEGPSPARVAVASLAGLPPAMASEEASEAVFSSLREGVEATRGWISGDDKTALEDALRKKQAGRVLAVVAPFAERAAPERVTAEQGSVLRRRKGALQALLAQRDAIGQLKAEAAAIFAAAAVSAAELIGLSSLRAEESTAIATMSRLLELEPAALLALSREQLAERFQSEGERKMRQLLGVLSTDALLPGEVIERFLGAIVDAGGGTVLLDSAAASKQEGFAGAALRALVEKPQLAEPVLREALERRPLEEAVTRLALAGVARLGTERLSLVIGRRFFELRKISRFALMDAVVQCGDVRLLPLIESRAFPGEAEELGWAVLALLRGDAVEGRLAEALERIEKSPAPTDAGETEDGIRLPLECKRCKEALIYDLKRVYVDPKSERQDGDPAFVGDVACKACGAEDQLAPTPLGVQLMQESMLRLLQAARMGLSEVPKVMPRSLRAGGKEVGIAAALREADRAVAESPDSIRARLRRGRLRLILWRTTAKEDAEKVLELDPRSPEGLMILGGTAAQHHRLEEARDHLSAAWRLLHAADEPRIYEGDAKGLSIEVEDALLELEDLEQVLPEDVDLSAARKRRDEELDKHRAAMEEREMRLRMQAGQARQAAKQQQAADRPAFLRNKPV